jgi:hypothetical protein
VADKVKSDTFRMVVYDNRPVQLQRRVDNNIEVVFYDGRCQTITEREWKEQSRSVFVPKNLGGRGHVARNWHKYSLYYHTPS